MGPNGQVETVESRIVEFFSFQSTLFNLSKSQKMNFEQVSVKFRGILRVPWFQPAYAVSNFDEIIHNLFFAILAKLKKSSEN